jgi:hypothetical protein
VCGKLSDLSLELSEVDSNTAPWPTRERLIRVRMTVRLLLVQPSTMIPHIRVLAPVLRQSMQHVQVDVYDTAGDEVKIRLGRVTTGEGVRGDDALRDHRSGREEAECLVDDRVEEREL